MLHRADITAIATYAAGGGLTACFGFAAAVDPGRAPIYLAAGAALISVAGIIRIVANPTPTNSVTVTDKTGSTVNIRTVAAPTPPPEG